MRNIESFELEETLKGCLVQLPAVNKNTYTRSGAQGPRPSRPPLWATCASLTALIVKTSSFLPPKSLLI